RAVVREGVDRPVGGAEQPLEHQRVDALLLLESPERLSILRGVRRTCHRPLELVAAGGLAGPGKIVQPAVGRLRAGQSLDVVLQLAGSLSRRVAWRGSGDQ